MEIDFPPYLYASAGFGAVALGALPEVQSLSVASPSIQIPQAAPVIRKEFPETWIWISVNNDRFVMINQEIIISQNLHQQWSYSF